MLLSKNMCTMVPFGESFSKICNLLATNPCSEVTKLLNAVLQLLYFIEIREYKNYVDNLTLVHFFFHIKTKSLNNKDEGHLRILVMIA